MCVRNKLVKILQTILRFGKDDDMIRTGIAALEAVLPEEEGQDRW